ncbi:MAG TPA: tetratricopeptide repeat protein [Bryobacteraceae bacterium]|nr:tetratricopeptide repeat protein [Bryobacteraceae bacterium]
MASDSIFQTNKSLRTGTSVWVAALIFGSVWLAGCGKSASQYLDRGNQLFKAGKYNDATLNYRNAVKKNPQSSEAYYRLALALLKQGNANEAYQSLNRAVTLDPKNNPAKVDMANFCLSVYARDPRHPAALYKQAQTLADQLTAPGGNPAEGSRLKGAIALIDNHPGMAIDSFRQALRLAPDSAEASVGLAEALFRDNQPEEGERAARQTVDSHPQFAGGYEALFNYYAAQQSWDKAEALLKLWAAKNPKDSGPLLRMAAFYYGRKQPDDAEKVLKSIVDRPADFPQADMLVGDFHALARNPEKALEDYRRGESRDHEHQQVYQERVASMLATLGRRDEALKSADAMLAKDPKNLFARTLKVQLLDEIGGTQNLTTAATMAGDLAKEAPANARVQMLAGQTALRKGTPDQAFAYFQQAAKADPRLEAAQLSLARMEMLRKNYSGVLQHADAALAIRRNGPNARLFRVIGLTGTRAYAQAKLEAEQLASDTKDAPQVEMQLGIIALGQGRYSQAEDYFRKLYKEGSPDIQPLAGLVNAYEAEHQPERALQLMQAEVQKSPDSPGKAALLVATEEAAGKTDQALAELQKVAAQNPKSADVQVRIAQLEIKHDHPAEALQALQKAQQLAPDGKGLDMDIGSVEDQMGKKADAIASYRKALAKTPDNPLVLNNLAFLLADTGGNLTEAQQMVTTAIRKAPNVPQLQDTLAWVQLKQHNEAAALRILATLTSEHPNEANFRYHYAVALNDTGNRSAAKLQAETALSKKPPAETAALLRNLLAKMK